MFADVIVDIQHEKLDKIFQYRIPEELESRLQPGMEVVVPFGKGNRQIKGYVTGFSEKCEYDLSKVKSILSISEKGMEIETRLIALAAWMKEHYGGTMIQSLKTVLPIRQRSIYGFSFRKKKEKKSLHFIEKRTRRHGQDCWKHCLQTGF